MTTLAESMREEMDRISSGVSEAPLTQVGHNEDYQALLDNLGRAMMAVRPDLPMMSLDEWISEYGDQLTELERQGAYAILSMFDYDLQQR